MCGFIGVIGASGAVGEIYDGLVAIQHRGQDAAGIITYDGDRFHLKKGEGLVRDIFTTANVLRLKGDMALGHVRYPTVGSGGGEDAQPFTVNFPFGIAMAICSSPQFPLKMREPGKPSDNSDRIALLVAKASS